jgi:hypothetical protein
MATITVDTSLGPVNFKISGEQPTSQEARKINQVIASPEKFLPEDFVASARQQQKGMFEGFDYSTGVKDAGLRASVSLAETPDEEVAQLGKYGLGEGDYIRDPRGKLALTPQGAAKFGMETDKNVVIDEAGVSRYDFADLAGFGPEVGGAVAGAITGQAAIPVPIVGAAIGAAIGAGGASLAEEAVEAATGTSKQSGSEIAKDALTEAAIAGTGEALFGLVAKGFGAVAKGSMPRALNEDQLRAYGESRELGVMPAVGLIGGNPLISRAQAIGEQVFRGSTRTKKNAQAIVDEVEKLRSVAGTADPDDLGRVLMEAAKNANNSVKQAEKNAAKAVLRGLRDYADDLGRASEKDLAIDDDLFNGLKTAVETFDSQAAAKFSSIDEAIKDAVGNVEVIPTGQIANAAKDSLRKLQKSTIGGNVTEAKGMLDSLAAVGSNSSFSQLYYLRKNLNDFLMRNPGKNTIQQYGDPILKQIDAVLDAGNLESMLLNSGRMLDPQGIAKVRAASKSFGDARSFFREGSRKLEEIGDIASINAIRNEIRNGVRVNPANIANKLVRPNNPESIRRLETVLGDVTDFAALKQRVGGEWIRKNLGAAVNDLDPKKFNGYKFKQAIDDLGSTADELFGQVVARQLRDLGDELAATSLSKVDDTVIRAVEDVLAGSALGDKGPSIGLLKNLALAQRDAHEVMSNSLIRKLSSPNMDPMEAASLVANAATKPDDINRIMKYFANQQSAKDKIRGYYMENLIGDFGDSFMTDPKQLKAFGNRLQKEYKSGKLGALFGDQMAKDMNKFGRVLVFNSQTVDGGGIVAAGIATSPFKNLGKLARYSVIGRLLSSDLFYKNIDAQYAALSRGAANASKANQLGKIIANGLNSATAQLTVQAGDESVREVTRQAQALMNTYEEQQRQQERRRAMPQTPVPQVTAPSLPQVQSNGAQQTIRDRARENPAVAATLLGGLGSASLL